MVSEISQSAKGRTISFHSYVGYKTKTYRDQQQHGGYQRKWGKGLVKGANMWGWKTI